MTRRKEKLKPKQINLRAIEAGIWKFIKGHPIYSAMYHDEIVARGAEEARRVRINRRGEKISR